MPRPKTKTSTTTLKMTPEVRNLWERSAAQERRSLTNMFEVMVRQYARQNNIGLDSASTPGPDVLQD